MHRYLLSIVAVALFGSVQVAAQTAVPPRLPPPPQTLKLPQPIAAPAAGDKPESTTQFQGGEGATTAVVVTRAPPPGVDLKIAGVEWLAPQPLHDESEFLRTVEGLGGAAARAPMLVPRLFADAFTQTTGPQQKSSANQSVVLSPVMRVKVSNDGKTRWASDGLVDIVVYQGTPEEIEKPGGTRALLNASKVLVKISSLPLGVGSWANPGTLFGGIGSIPGSIGPHETTDVQVAFLNGINHPKDRMARYRYRMLVDKYYTADVSVRASGDDTPNNDKVYYVFRIAANGALSEGRLVQRENVSSGVTVTGGGGVTVTRP